jgi:hypothetical protein
LVRAEVSVAKKARRVATRSKAQECLMPTKWFNSRDIGMAAFGLALVLSVVAALAILGAIGRG